MRVTFFILIAVLFLALCAWVLTSGFLLTMATVLLLLFVVITIGYTDTAILYFLGAREVQSSDEKAFFEAAAHEAYKLAVKVPKLYFYNGTLERGFILQNKQNVSLVLSKQLLKSSTREELSAICFELLLQVKKGMASKRTKVMFILGLKSWIGHGLIRLLLILVPMREVRDSMNFILNYLLHPWLDLIFKITMGKGYFKKLNTLMSEFPHEEEVLRKVGLKLRKPDQVYSLPSRKLIELSTSSRSGHYQNIITLEFLPHEWDFLFKPEELSVKEA